MREAGTDAAEAAREVRRAVVTEYSATAQDDLRRIDRGAVRASDPLVGVRRYGDGLDQQCRHDSEEDEDESHVRPGRSTAVGSRMRHRLLPLLIGHRIEH